MITEKQFLEAVDIIKEYQIQISEIVKEITEIKNEKTLVSDWLNSQRGKISVRLENILRKDKDCRGNSNPKYIEDFNKKNFCLILGGGSKSWVELCELINKTPHE